MSSSTSPSQNPSSGPPQTLDRSQSAPAAMEQASAPGQRQDQPGFQELLRRPSPPEAAASTAHQVQPHPLPVHSDSEVPRVPSPSSDTPPADMPMLPQQPEGEDLCAAADGDAESFEVANSSEPPHPEELSPVQPMEQEMTESDAADPSEACPSVPSQCDSVEMESPPTSQGAAGSERDQPEGERCSSSDSIPSLAAALMELHELLVSNNRQSRSTSCSPSHPFRQDAEDAAPEPRTPTPQDAQPTPSTAITAGEEPSHAKANQAAAAPAEGPSESLVPDPSGQDEHHGGDSAESAEEQGPPEHHPLCSGGRGADGCGLDGASNISDSQPKPEGLPDPGGSLEFREPPEGQQGRGVADGQASGANSPDTLGLQAEQTFLSPLSMAVGSGASPPSAPALAQAPQPTSAAPLLPSPHPFIEQFPAEHIQRIQAAGFSAREAAEALEQAHGVVELALLALLARSITVPT